MSKTKRNTAPVVIRKEYHEAMTEFYENRKIKKRHQVELALDKFFKKEAPAIFKILMRKKKELKKNP